jgi:hypothetical protein
MPDPTPRATDVVEVRVQVTSDMFAALEARAARARQSIGCFLREQLAASLAGTYRDNPNPDGT